jgi:hypothetical protein
MTNIETNAKSVTNDNESLTTPTEVPQFVDPDEHRIDDFVAQGDHLSVGLHLQRQPGANPIKLFTAVIYGFL